MPSPFFLILVIGLTFQSKGQVIESRIQEETEILRKKGVDTFFTYSYQCSGRMPQFDTCAFEEPEYLLWVQNKKYYIRKFDYCRSYSAILLDSINPFSYFLAFKSQIGNEEIKAPSYVSSKNRKTKTIVTSAISQDCFFEMSFQIRKNNMIKKVSDYSLTFKYFDDGKKNMYYNYNQSTKLKILISQITSLVEKLNTQSNFQSQLTSSQKSDPF